MINVSFIIIGYNVEKYILRCIQSVTKQTMKSIEIIYVDDGSTDNSVKEVESIANNDKRISIIKQKNYGPHQARMAGLKEARGKYVIFIDSDDWVDCELAEKTFDLAENKNVDIVVYNYFYAYNNNNLIEHNNKINNSSVNNTYLQLIMSNLISNNIWDKLIKRELITSDNIINFNGMKVGEDLVVNVLLGVSMPKVYITNDHLYYYFQRQDSVMNESSKKILEIEQALDYVKEILVKENLFFKYQEQYNYLCFLHYYIGRVVCTKLNVDRYHKQMYYIWKNKKINYKTNIYCKNYVKSMSFYSRILIRAFDMNYQIGKLILKFKLWIK